MTAKPERLLVLGAGITGLVAAHEAVKRARSQRRTVEVTVLESSSRIGGKVQTESRDGVLIETGPDSFVTLKPDMLDLVKELGLSGELLKTHPTRKTVYVYTGGAMLPLPEGMGVVPSRLWPFVTSGLLSWRGKARAALEVLLPPEDGSQEESLGSFIRRRLGPEVLEKIAGPMLAGIYAGDPEQMSLESTFPQLKELERGGGLIRSVLRGKPRSSEASRSLFMTVKGGLSRVIEALALGLPGQTVRTGVAVSSLSRRNGHWEARTAAGIHAADAVIAALPANALAPVVEDLDIELACVLREIPFVSTATVTLVYEEKGFANALDGYGFLVPRSEGRQVLAGTYSSTKFEGRVPPGLVMIRCFLGGAGREAAAEADEQAVARTARNELREMLGLGEAHPKITRAARWIKANPQYTVGHALRLSRIESCLQAHRGLVLAGCSYRGVGLADCVRSGREAAAKALEALMRRAPAGVA